MTRKTWVIVALLVVGAMLLTWRSARSSEGACPRGTKLTWVQSATDGRVWICNEVEIVP